MLLRFKIKNFLSFHEEAVFDMFPNIKRPTFSHHIYTDIEVPLLKQAVIYGANGSGKSNFIKALIFLREFVTRENFLKSVDLDDYIFRLTNEKSQTVSFEIEFLHEDRYYLYVVGISKENVFEKLSISGLGKSEDTLLFERKGNSIQSPHIQNVDSTRQLLSMNPQSSILPLNLLFPILSSHDVKKASDWFSEQLKIITVNSTIPKLINLLFQKHEILNFTNKVFQSIGVGIREVAIRDTPFEEWAKSKNTTELQQIIDRIPEPSNTNIAQVQNNRNVLNITIQKGVKTVQELLFDQFGQADCHRAMSIAAQSDGTVRLLTLIPALYSAMNEKKTVVIDEIDNSIHPNLMFELIRFYANNKSNGQLIFTTHTTKLLNQQELVRPDEVWLTEKSEGNTRIFSLNDFKLHNTLNIENGYLDGRYGAVPIIEELSIEQ
jgi:AAA15 family ATPase/GTPase